MPTEADGHQSEDNAPAADDQRLDAAETPHTDETPHAAEPALPELIGKVLEQVAGLRQDFDTKIRYDEVKDQHAQQMSDELAEYRAGLHRRLLQPVLTDLIAMYDDLTDALGDAPDGDSEVDDAVKMLRSLRDSILETLLRNGVSSFSVDTADIDKSRQKVIELMPTGDQALDRQVARRIRVGFEFDDGKVLRPEWVAAHRYLPSEPATVTSKGDNSGS
jgi:molecular chaperone GrpE